MLSSILKSLWETLGSTGTLLLALAIFLIIFLPRGRPKNFPPGVPILPVVGSLPFTKGAASRSFLIALKKKYGDLASFAIFNSRVVMVSNLKTIKEVFTQAKTTGRPELLLTTTRNSIMTEGRYTDLGILGSSGEQWQEQRRFVLRHLKDLGFGKTSLEPLIYDEINELMDHIATQKDEPIVVKRLFNRSIINVIWGMVMGKRYLYNDDKLKTLLKTFITPADINFLSPLHFIPGILPLAPYLPFFKEVLRPFFNVTTFIKGELEEFRREGKEKTSDCLTAVYLREIEKHEGKVSTFHMDQLKCVIFEMFVGGSETTSSTLSMSIYLIAKHQEVQNRVHEELDRVVGRDNKPSFSQMSQLSYTLATLHEVQRTFRMVPFSLPHKALEDIHINGYIIPKGTILLGNMEDSMTDPSLWRNPKEFDPRNFLDDEGKYKANDAFLPFGSGKRQCVGEPLARLELFLFFACLMQRFHFYGVDEVTFHDNNPLVRPTPTFTVKAKPRF